MATSIEKYIGEWHITVNDGGRVETGQMVNISVKDDQAEIEYMGQTVTGVLVDGLLSTEFIDPGTGDLFRVIFAYYEQQWQEKPWRSIFALTVDTDPNDAGVWGAEETGNPQ